MLFLPVMLFDFIGLFRQGGFDHHDEIPTIGHCAANTEHCVPFRAVVRDGQNIAIVGKSVRSPLNHFIRGLAPARKEHFNAGIR